MARSATAVLRGTPLATTVVGSYSVPEWLGRLKTDYYQRRISAHHLDEIHEVAIKAALKDQELAGVDIVSDGELRRDNDIDYLLTRIPGVEIPDRAKTDYYDYYATPAMPTPRTWSGRWRAGSTRRRGNWPGPAQTCCRSMSRSWPATPSRWTWRSRRSTS